jgi:hypothetical protein
MPRLPRGRFLVETAVPFRRSDRRYYDAGMPEQRPNPEPEPGAGVVPRLIVIPGAVYLVVRNDAMSRGEEWWRVYDRMLTAGRWRTYSLPFGGAQYRWFVRGSDRVHRYYMFGRYDKRDLDATVLADQLARAKDAEDGNLRRPRTLSHQTSDSARSRATSSGAA